MSVTSSTPFDDAGGEYLESSIFTEGEDLNRVAKVLDGRDTVLDVGAGTLHTAGYLQGRGVSRTVALDPSRPMLMEGRSRYQSVIPVAGTSEAIPFRDENFDGLVTRYAAHHFLDPFQAFREMKRVLESDGKMVFQDLVIWEADELGERINWIAELRDPSHERYRTVGEWTDLLEKVGFKVIERTEFRLSLTYEDWWERSDPDPESRQKIESLFDRLNKDQRRRINLSASDGRPETFEYPVAMVRCTKNG